MRLQGVWTLYTMIKPGINPSYVYLHEYWTVNKHVTCLPAFVPLHVYLCVTGACTKPNHKPVMCLPILVLNRITNPLCVYLYLYWTESQTCYVFTCTCTEPSHKPVMCLPTFTMYLHVKEYIFIFFPKNYFIQISTSNGFTPVNCVQSHGPS